MYNGYACTTGFVLFPSKNWVYFGQFFTLMSLNHPKVCGKISLKSDDTFIHTVLRNTYKGPKNICEMQNTKWQNPDLESRYG